LHVGYNQGQQFCLAGCLRIGLHTLGAPVDRDWEPTGRRLGVL
jgi:hypothetical protein